MFNNQKENIMEKICKNCGSKHCTKNGIVRGKQRYKCKSCGYNFVIGDQREKASPEAKALAVLLYSTGKLSYGFISKLFNVSRTAVLKWIRNVASRLQEPTKEGQIQEVQKDEMWLYINEINKSYGYGEPWIALQTKPSDGLLAIVLLKPLKSSIEN